MGLSKLSEKCRVCPKVDTCDHKRMEALAYMVDPCGRELAAAAVPDVSAHVDIQVNMEATLRDALIEEIAKAVQLPKHILCGHYPYG